MVCNKLVVIIVVGNGFLMARATIYSHLLVIFGPFPVDWSPGHYAPMSDGTGTGASLVDAPVILSANLSLPILPDNPYILACPDGYGLRGVRLYSYLLRGE